MIKTKIWVLALMALLILCLAAIVVPKLLIDDSSAWTAKVMLDGKCVEQIELGDVDKPYSFAVTGSIGVNIISVEYGRICVSEAQCPDQICVQKGWISNGTEMIVCLPNKLVVQLVPADDMAEDEWLPDGVVQ